MFTDNGSFFLPLLLFFFPPLRFSEQLIMAKSLWFIAAVGLATYVHADLTAQIEKAIQPIAEKMAKKYGVSANVDRPHCTSVLCGTRQVTTVFWCGLRFVCVCVNTTVRHLGGPSQG